MLPAITLSEPMTLATDYVLAGVTASLGWWLWRGRAGDAARASWALAFAAIALAALAGGTWHGFALHLPAGVLEVLWKTTVLSVGVASFGMLYGSAAATAAGSLRSVLLVLAAVKLALYSAWMLTHDDFRFVIADTGAAMAGVAALHLWSHLRTGDGASKWMLAGVVVSALAASVQAGGLALHAHFNHNDLYHVIQIAAMILFYRGARGLHDRSWHSDA